LDIAVCVAAKHALLGIVEVHQPGGRELLEVGDAIEVAAMVFGNGQGRQEQCRQHSNHGNHHQQLNEREGVPLCFSPHPG